MSSDEPPRRSPERGGENYVGAVNV